MKKQQNEVKPNDLNKETSQFIDVMDITNNKELLNIINGAGGDWGKEPNQKNGE